MHPKDLVSGGETLQRMAPLDVWNRLAIAARTETGTDASPTRA